MPENNDGMSLCSNAWTGELTYCATRLHKSGHRRPQRAQDDSRHAARNGRARWLLGVGGVLLPWRSNNTLMS